MTINQLVSSLLGLLIYQERIDFRMLFRSTHLPVLIFSTLFALAMIMMFNMSIAIPRRKAKTRVTFSDITVRINIVLSVVLITMLSWNLRYLYKNWENVNAVPGLASKIIILVILRLHWSAQ